MKLLFSILVLQAIVSTAVAKVNMECTVSDQKTSEMLVAPSEFETHLNEGRFKGLNINVIENSAGDSYSVIVMKNEELIVSATLPFYVDADLKFKHKGSLFTVICEK